MIDKHVVGLGIAYLDECAATGQQPTLVGMHWYIDSRNKTLPLTEEVNAALAQRPFFVRREGSVVFATEGSERSVTDEDMRRAGKRYNKEFWAAYRKLQR
jgi:hypothetical protein